MDGLDLQPDAGTLPVASSRNHRACRELPRGRWGDRVTSQSAGEALLSADDRALARPRRCPAGRMPEGEKTPPARPGSSRDAWRAAPTGRHTRPEVRDRRAVWPGLQEEETGTRLETAVPRGPISSRGPASPHSLCRVPQSAEQETVTWSLSCHL